MKLRLFEADGQGPGGEDDYHTFKVWARDFDDAWELAYAHAAEHLPGVEVYGIVNTGITSEGHAEYPDA